MIMDNYRYIEAEDYYDMASAWINHRNYEKAEECLNHVIDLNPGFVYAYIDLAYIHALNGAFHDAIHVLKKATHHDPAFDRIYYLMAKYAYKDGDFRNAVHFIGQACDINPSAINEKVKRIIEIAYHRKRR